MCSLASVILSMGEEGGCCIEGHSIEGVCGIDVCVCAWGCLPMGCVPRGCLRGGVFSFPTDTANRRAVRILLECILVIV